MEDIKTLIHGDAKNDQIEAIDQLVYKLYDLTPDEIAVVEGNKN